MAGAAAQDQWEDVTPGAIAASPSPRAGKSDDEWEDVTPTPKAAVVAPAKSGFLSTVAADVGSMVKPMIGIGGVQREDPEQFRQRFAAMSPEQKVAQIAQTRAVAVGMPHSDIASTEARNYQTRLASGQSMPRAVAETAYEAGAGANMTAFDEAARQGNTGEALGHLAAPVVLGAATYGAGRIPEVADALGETRAVQSVKDSIGRATRAPGVIEMQPDGSVKVIKPGPLKPGVKIASRIVGAGAGAVAGEAGLGPYGAGAGGYAGWRVGPEIANAILPEHPNPVGAHSNIPNRVNLPEPELPGTGAPLPDTGEFYENKAEDLMKRGKEQDALDRKAKADAQRQAKTGISIVGQETAGAPVNVGSEGRPATWTNEKVLELAAKGNRDAITQVARRQLPMPENARYVMGDVDVPRVVSNPREVTRFNPDGTPIRNTANPRSQNPSSRARIQIVGEQPGEAAPAAPSNPPAPTGPTNIGPNGGTAPLPTLEEYEKALTKNGMNSIDAHAQAREDLAQLRENVTIPKESKQVTRERIDRAMRGEKLEAPKSFGNKTGTDVEAERVDARRTRDFSKEAVTVGKPNGSVVSKPASESARELPPRSAETQELKPVELGNPVAAKAPEHLATARDIDSMTHEEVKGELPKLRNEIRDLKGQWRTPEESQRLADAYDRVGKLDRADKGFEQEKARTAAKEEKESTRKKDLEPASTAWSDASYIERGKMLRAAGHPESVTAQPRTGVKSYGTKSNFESLPKTVQDDLLKVKREAHLTRELGEGIPKDLPQKEFFQKAIAKAADAWKEQLGPDVVEEARKLTARTGDKFGRPEKLTRLESEKPAGLTENWLHIKVPGDGDFKIANRPGVVAELERNADELFPAKRSPKQTAPRKIGPRAAGGTELQHANAIKRMEEGIKQAEGPEWLNPDTNKRFENGAERDEWLKAERENVAALKERLQELKAGKQ